MVIKMKNKKAYLITGIFLAVLLLVLTLLFLVNNRVTMNPPGTVGNTAGNLNNSGYFCEYNGMVYFANSYDNGSLYSMTTDEQNMKKINNLTVRNILAGGDSLYYFTSGGEGDAGLGTVRSVKSFNRSKLNGNNTIGLTREIVLSGQLVDNYLYLLTGDGEQVALVKLKIDKSEETVLADYEINPACVNNGTIYYNGTQSNHYLYSLNTANNSIQEVWNGNLWNPIVQGDYVYYMDVAENYRLCRYSLSQASVEVLTEDRVDCFNVGNGYIYYQSVGENAALKCMHTDGSNVITVALGVYNNINMTSQYVYFQEFRNDTATYHARLGSAAYSTFDAAKAVVLEK